MKRESATLMVYGFLISAMLCILFAGSLFLFSKSGAQSEKSIVASQLALPAEVSWAQIQFEVYCKIATPNIYRGDLENELGKLGELARYGNSPNFIYTYPNSQLGKYVTIFGEFDSENRLQSRRIIEDFALSSDYFGPQINCDK